MACESGAGGRERCRCLSYLNLAILLKPTSRESNLKHRRRSEGRDRVKKEREREGGREIERGRKIEREREIERERGREGTVETNVI